MKHITAGRRNQKITLYKPVTGKTASGAPAKNKFEKISTPWASIITKQLSEKQTGDSSQSQIVYSIVIAWREVRPDWVITWRKQLLRITAIDDSDPSRRQKALLAVSENGVNELVFLESDVLGG